MKNDITKSTLLEFLNGELDMAGVEAVEKWLQASEKNRQDFSEVQKGYCRARWAVREALIGDHSRLYLPVNKRRTNLRRWIAAAVLLPIATAVSLLFIFSDNSGDNEKIALVGQLTDQVILELSDGSQHIVNPSADTTLTEKSGARVAIVSGEIIYDNPILPNEAVYNKLTVPRGSNIYKLTLGDGSTVWLNSDSHLEYPLNFSGDERRVSVAGEAFFDIVRDESKPFIVETSGHLVTVLGTQFNISGYPGEPVITTLATGRVHISVGDVVSPVHLSPGQQSSVSPEAGIINVTAVDVENFISWKDGILSVEKVSLEDILKKIARKYDVSFDLTDADLTNVVLRGSIPMGVSLETVLSVINKTTNVEFKVKKNGEIKVTLV